MSVSAKFVSPKWIFVAMIILHLTLISRASSYEQFLDRLQRILAKESFKRDNEEVTSLNNSIKSRSVAHPNNDGVDLDTGPNTWHKSSKTAKGNKLAGHGHYRGKRRFICPPMTRATKSKRTGKTPVSINFNNWSDVPSQLVWIDYEGGRRNMGSPIPPGGSQRMRSVPGRVYAAYSVRGGDYRLMINYKCLWYVNNGDNFAAITE